MRVSKLESDNVVECSGSCRECARCYSVVTRWMVVVIMHAWFDSRTALLNSSSSAVSHCSSNVGVSLSGEQYPRRRERSIYHEAVGLFDGGLGGVEPPAKISDPPAAIYKNARGGSTFYVPMH